MRALPLILFLVLSSSASAMPVTQECGKVQAVRASIDEGVGALQTVTLQGSTTQYVVVSGLIPAVSPLVLASKQSGKEICFEGMRGVQKAGILRIYVEAATYY